MSWEIFSRSYNEANARVSRFKMIEDYISQGCPIDNNSLLSIGITNGSDQRGSFTRDYLVCGKCNTLYTAFSKGSVTLTNKGPFTSEVLETLSTNNEIEHPNKQNQRTILKNQRNSDSDILDLLV